MENKKLLGVVIAVIIIIVGAGFLSFFANSSAAVVKVGYLPVSTAVVSLTAKPILESQGIEVELIRFESSNDMVTALEASKIDVADAIGLPTILSAEARSPGNLKVFAMAIEDDEHYSNYFLVPINSTVTTILDLRGKKIVSRPGATPRDTVALILKYFNLTLNDVQLVQVEPQSQITLLASGQADAGLFIEPTASAALSTGAIKVFVANPRGKYILLPYPAAGFVYSKSFASKSLSTQVENAYARAIDEVRSDEASAKNLLVNLGVAKDSATAQKAKLTAFWKLQEIDTGNLQRFAQILVESGELARLIDASTLFYRA